MLKVKTTRDWRDEFCALLRSGKYKQHEGSHAYGLRACALQAWFHHNHGHYAGESNMLPLEESSSESYGKFAERTLDLRASIIYEMNDRGMPFSEIAHWVEAHNV